MQLKKISRIGFSLAMMFFGSMQVKADWKIDGPIVVRSLGTIEVRVLQDEARNLSVQLRDENGSAIRDEWFDGSYAEFSGVKPGTYYIYVETDGVGPLRIFTKVVSQQAQNSALSGHHSLSQELSST